MERKVGVLKMQGQVIPGAAFLPARRTGHTWRRHPGTFLSSVVLSVGCPSLTGLP